MKGTGSESIKKRMKFFHVLRKGEEGNAGLRKKDP